MSADLYNFPIEEDLEAVLQDTPGYAGKGGSARLTVALLQSEIPKIREGEEAERKLRDSGLTIEEVRHLNRTKRAGTRAKEALFVAALPLIRTIALREYRRRQQWGSRISLEDLTQEAIVGFFKGIAGFKTEAIRKSATNYLGQWMLVEMRRAAEVMDHDLQVGHDAGERFRRVRALRSRLSSELGREPTDEEISEASRNPAYVTRPGMVGKAPADGQKAAVGKGMTAAQVNEERLARARVGSALRIASSEDGDSERGPGVGFVDLDRIGMERLGENFAGDPADLIADEQTTRIVSALVSQILEEASIGETQCEVVRRRFGLAPFTEETSARSISKEMGIHRERVARILTAFTAEMTTPGASLHRIVTRIERDDLVALGLGWLVDALGPWDELAGERHILPAILVDPVPVSVVTE